MIESGRTRLNVVQQLAAATTALMGAKDTSSATPIDHSMVSAVGSDGRDKLEN